MLKGRNGRSRTSSSTPIDNSHHAHGLIAQSPLALLVIVIVLGVAVWLVTEVQISNTEQSVYALLQAGVTVIPGQTGAQVSAFMNGQTDYYQGIADVIGWCVQLALLMVSFPPDSALLSMHRRFSEETSPSLTQSAMKQEKWRMLISRGLIAGDVLTDFLHVVGSRSLVTLHGLALPDISSATLGVVVVGLLFPACICFVTVFGAKYLLVFLEALIEKITHTTTSV